MTVIIAKAVAVFKMYRGAIGVGFFDDFHGAILHAQIAVEAAVGKIVRILGARG